MLKILFFLYLLALWVWNARRLAILQSFNAHASQTPAHPEVDLIHSL